MSDDCQSPASTAARSATKVLRRRRDALRMLAGYALAGAARPALAEAAPPTQVDAARPADAGSGPIVIVDDRGIEHRFADAPRRIVTMLPSLTETAWVLGAGARLVGVDRFSDWPDEIASLPRLGGLEDAHIEAIAALAPDVVLASTASRAMERLEALGFRIVRLKSETHADLRRTLDLVAALLGTPAAGARAWARIEREIEAAARRVPPQMLGQRVYFEIGGGPYAAGASSFVGETIARLGLANIVEPQLGPFPKLNPEYVVRAKPDIIVGTRREQAALVRRPGWGALAAVREQRLCGFDTPQYDLLTRPGPRAGEAAALLVDCLVELAESERRRAPSSVR
ncbi:MAG: ABC transporter substrate-binding protein [Limnobacter sp.]|nr:ABC transporter substrate-binding protein [Limnobacter sp.]